MRDMFERKAESGKRKAWRRSTAVTRSELGRAPRLGRDRRSKHKRNVDAMPGRSASPQAYARPASGFSSRMPLFAKIVAAENSLRPTFATIFRLDANIHADCDIESPRKRGSMSQSASKQASRQCFSDLDACLSFALSQSTTLLASDSKSLEARGEQSQNARFSATRCALARYSAASAPHACSHTPRRALPQRAMLTHVTAWLFAPTWSPEQLL